MKKAAILTLVLIQMLAIANGQYIRVDHRNNKTKYFNAANGFSSVPKGKPELLKNGFLDFLDNGNIQASARVLLLNIGEPDKFYIPFLIYSGVAGQAFGENKENKTTVSNLLNPVGGVVNLSFSNNYNLLKGAENTYTKLQFSFQLGGRLVNGMDTITGKSSGFFNGFSNAGIYFQTGAWEDGSKSIGIFWLQLKASASVSSKAKLDNFFGSVESEYLYGYTFDGGIEVDGVINFKLSVFKYLNNKDIALLSKPVVKFSLDYQFAK